MTTLDAHLDTAPAVVTNSPLRGPLGPGAATDCAPSTRRCTVSASTCSRALGTGRLPPPIVVTRRRSPTPTSTAPFPNPEEPGVLDLALDLAGRHRADLVLANDPDADRLAARTYGERLAGAHR